MLNRSIRDLESATVRTRFFGGRSIDSIAAEMPLLPVDAPGLPEPGPSFKAFAQVIGDPPPQGQVIKGRKKPVYGRADGAYLTALVRSALYMSGSSVTMVGEQYPTVLHPGLLSVGDPHGDPLGPSPCRLMVVGKAFNRQEVASGRPFSSEVSRALWDAWAEAGMPFPNGNEPVFLTNLVRFAPPPTLARIPSDWISDGLHLLMQEIALCRPQVMLVLGSDPLKALFGRKAKISDYRGRVADFEMDCRPCPEAPADIHRAKVIVAENPAAVYHEPDNYPLVLAGVKATAELLGYAAPVKDPVALDHQPVYTTAELKVAVRESVAASAAGGYISFDCEWEGRPPFDPDSYVYTVQWSHAPGHARTVFLRRCGGAPNAALPMEEAVPLLKQLFEGAPRRGARLVAHFGKADLPALMALGVDLYPHFVGPDDDPADMPNRLEGWQKTYFEGGFDTYVGCHSWEESQDMKLEILAATHLRVPRYDTAVREFVEKYCKDHKISRRKLKGYGNISEELIGPYGMWDADATGRLYLWLNGDPRTQTQGVLEKDRFGRSCRKIFGIRMRAWAAWAEMERYGLEVDRKQQRELREVLAAKRTELLDQLRADANWPELDLAKTRHRVEFLFGPRWINWPQQSPQTALCLYLTPYKSTATSYGGRLWPEVMAMYEADPSDGTPSPSSDQETIIHLGRQHHLVEAVRDIDFMTTAMKILFRLPDEVDEDDESEDAGEEHYSAGILSLICGDDRLRSVFGLVETGRASSSRPNMQNFSSGRDEQFDRIFKWGKYADENSANAERHFISRSIIKAKDGWFFVSADLKGAEILVAAGLSGDPLLMEHAQRANLDEKDPQYLDLHSDLANRAFNLNLPLAEVKKKFKPLRVAAKRVRFGHYYGAAADTAHRQALEDDPNITFDQIVDLIDTHDKTYPVLTSLFEGCRSRAVNGPGWLANGFGGTRRFRRATARSRLSGQGREAQNWICQGTVADAMNVALGNIWYELRRRRLRSRIVLSVHDSAMLECPPDEVELVVDEILPVCMTERTAVVPTDLNGTPNGRPPFHFGIDIEVFRSWGVPVDDSEWRKGVAKPAA